MRDSAVILVVIGLIALMMGLWAGWQLTGCTYLGVSDQIICSEGYKVGVSVS